MSRALLIAGIAATLLVSGPVFGDRAGPGSPSGWAAVEATPPLVLALEVPGVPLDGVLSAYERGPSVLLPLGELLRMLDVAIDIDPSRGLAEGFFLSERRRFHLDAGAREVRRGNKTFPWDSTGIVVSPDDIYVATTSLESWFDLKIEVRRQAATLIVRSAEPLPIQARAARARRVQQSLFREGASAPDFGTFHTPYRLWSRPFVDQQFTSTTLRRGDRRVSDWQSATYLTGDLLYMESDLYLRGERMDPLSDVHGSAGRRDPEPVLLGPLRAREYRAGEVGYPGLALVARPVSGPGFLVSNFPLQRPSQFGQHSFQGRLPEGWDVELYRDDALIAYQSSQSDGSFRFDGVPLLFGFNDFLLVFNGPHGERREEREAFNVGPSLTPPGELRYRLVASGLTEGRARAQLETDFHLAGSVSGSFALATVDLDDRAHYYATTGVRGFWSHLFAGADVAVDSAGGEAVELGFQARSRRFGAGVRHAVLSNGFRSEIFRSPVGAIERRTTGTLDATPAPFRSLRLPLQIELSSERLSGGAFRQAWANRVGLGLGRASLSHQMRQVVTSGSGSVPGRDTRNTLLMSVRARRWSLRGTLDYVPGRHGVWRDTYVLADGPVSGDIHAGVGVGHDPLARATRVFADLSTSQGRLGWVVRAEIGSRSPLSLGLGVSIGLDREPRRGRWHAHARPVAGSGAASAQVFLDSNGNGTRDADESPLAGVELIVNRAHTAQRTDDHGILFLTGLPGGQAVDVQLAAGSLEDPLWVPRVPGLRLIPRPGRATMVDFPVVMSGEVVGTVSVSRAEKTRPAGGVTLELVDAVSGEVVRQIVTAYDGFFDMVVIPPGRYRLRIAESQLARFGLAVAPSRAIEIAPTGTVHEGVDFVISPEPAPAQGP